MFEREAPDFSRLLMGTRAFRVPLELGQERAIQLE